MLLLYLFRCTIKRARRSFKTCIHIKITRRLKVNVETSQIPFPCANSPPYSSNQQYSVPWDGLLLWESIRGILVAVQRFATTSLRCFKSAFNMSIEARVSPIPTLTERNRGPKKPSVGICVEGDALITLAGRTAVLTNCKYLPSKGKVGLGHNVMMFVY